jgi:alkanesulfonate monooxygenase
MSHISLHWYLPTHGDGRTLMQAGAATQSLHMGRDALATRSDNSVTNAAPAPAGVRPATFDYVRHVATAAELAGFDAVLTPTGTWCEDAWVTASSLIPLTPRLRFLVAVRPGTISPTLAAQQVATFQRFSGGRLMLNIVTGAENVEQRRYGDRLDKDDRYSRTDEFLTVLRGAWSKPFDHHGQHFWVEGAYAPGVEKPPKIYFGGSSDAALAVAARHADVYLSWGEPPTQVSAHFDRVRSLAAGQGRMLRYGVRMHVVARPDAAQAWAAAEALLADADPEAVAAVQATFKTASGEGQRRMTALLVGRKDDNLEIYPNVWAGVALLRGGAGTALVGSYADVADRIAEYHANGVDEFILSGYPHIEEALWFSDGVMPLLRERELLAANA